MKNLFGKNMLKSIGISLVICLALSAVVIAIHASLGMTALKPVINGVKTCADDKEKCMWDEWKKDPESKLWKLEDKLNKNYPEHHQGTTLFANYVGNRTSVEWFRLYRSIVICAGALGIILGIILNLFYRRQLALEETKKSKKKSKK